MGPVGEGAGALPSSMTCAVCFAAWFVLPLPRFSFLYLFCLLVHLCPSFAFAHSVLCPPLLCPSTHHKCERASLNRGWLSSAVCPHVVDKGSRLGGGVENVVEGVCRKLSLEILTKFKVLRSGCAYVHVCK